MKARANLQSHSLEGAKESVENPAQPNICRTSWLREEPNQRVMNVDIGLVILDALDCETQISRLGQMSKCWQIVRTTEPSRWLRELNNLVFVPSCSCVRERSVCTTSVTNLQHVPVGAHAPVMANDHSNHVLVVTGTGLPAFSAESREIGRSVMETSEHSESKSDVGLGMIDTACLCMTGGQITKKMQMDVGLTHEIDETRAALVSSIRVTAPARAVVDMGEKTLRIWNRCR